MSNGAKTYPLASLPVIAGLAMGPAVAVGLARFSYALLLPNMKIDLHWTYAEAGLNNTANAAGYLFGAMAAAFISARIGEKRAFMFGMLLTVVALFGSALTENYLALALLRAVAGAAGALPFIVGSVLAAAAGRDGGAVSPEMALGIYFGGGGFGMFIAAVVIPAVVVVGDWRAGWIAMGILGLFGIGLAWPAVLRARLPTQATKGETARWSPLRLLPLLLSYVLFGAGYIAYATFIVAWLRTDLGFGVSEIEIFWAGVGGAAAIAGLGWAPALLRMRRGWSVALANLVVMVGVVLPVLSHTAAAAYASAILFGGSFLIVPTAVTAYARSLAPPSAWTAVIALLTVGFAVGQCAGPVMSGWISDANSGLSDGLLLSGGALLLASVIALMQRDYCCPQAKPAIR